jgi:hypothetical protein
MVSKPSEEIEASSEVTSARIFLISREEILHGRLEHAHFLRSHSECAVVLENARVPLLHSLLEQNSPKFRGGEIVVSLRVITNSQEDIFVMFLEKKLNMARNGKGNASYSLLPLQFDST